MPDMTAVRSRTSLPGLKGGGKMILSRTPLRISFVGGGTDIPQYYRHNGGGAVVNSAINRYMYIVVNRKFDNQIRVSYSTTEIVPTADEVCHPLVREALRLLDIRRGLEIVSISDIPSYGTGLGSSSSFTVGLLNALHGWLGEETSPKQLAEEAVRIEREIVGDPGGKQDQYIAAYGGLRLMEFHPDESVDVIAVPVSEEDLHALEESLLLFYTGIARAGAPILAGQITEMKENWEHYDFMKQLARDLYSELGNGRVDCLGEYLHKNWERKRRLHEAISNPTIEKLYSRARAAGATGGKITGAGGGGFLLLCTRPGNRKEVCNALDELREEPFRLEKSGSRIFELGE